MDEISFTTTRREHDTVMKIIDRAEKAGLVRSSDDRMSISMDLCATHANGCPMDFDRMLAADDFNFAHDYCGIARHLDRRTGKLGGMFRPRFAKAEVRS
ncbi:hypothetical protein [Bosea massiliensis]|uniref:DUF6874 domain-containing protein n=1 Tax=Bosea massiliensis TaxID=151419 RepID=A0ABW0PAS0_9HYPH